MTRPSRTRLSCLARGWGVAFALVLLTGNASGDDRVGVDPRDCRPASPREVEASGVVPWIGWHRFLASCPLRTALAAPGLTLIAADIRRHDATPPATRTTLPPERPNVRAAGPEPVPKFDPPTS